MQLSQLLGALPDARVSGPVDVAIGKIVSDSRQVEPGDLFVAIRGGEEADRHEFVPDALARRAGAVVVEEEIDTTPATRVLVGNCRDAAGRLAACFNHHPDRDLLMLGITGTNGKTTSAFLVRHMLEAAGRPSGYIGTLGLQIGAALQPVGNTTPEADQLYAHLRRMVAGGIEAAVLEVSSHALALNRVGDVSFDLAVFTNLSRDHLDFHESEAAYFEAKASLFDRLATGGTAVINADDAVAPALLERAREAAITYGFGAGAGLRAVSADTVDAGTRLTLEFAGSRFEVTTQLTGSFNCYNVMAAVACGLALGLESDAIAAGILGLETVPGRFERVRNGQPYEVIVDYAHTPAALETILATARELTSGRLICVFGCGGDRDRGKRPQMGRIASTLADLVLITSDNPRGERPESIINDIWEGVMDRGWDGRTGVTAEVDRHAAIGAALAAAEAGDFVVVAGKGHESGQEFADRVIPFDDRQVVCEWLVGKGGIL